jgi:hypothetical protein
MVFTSPGHSVEEIYAAGRKAKKIYDDIHDHYEHAPSPVKDLVDTCDYLSRILQDFATLLEQYGDTYPHEHTFDRKIEDCRIFVAHWQTSHSSFNGKQAQALKDGLSQEIHKLLTFILLFALYVKPQ